jgi:opacity protein-like surface antigen
MKNKLTKISCTLALLASVAATPAFSQNNFAGLSGSIGIGYDRAKDTVSDVGGTESLKENNWVPVLDLSYGINASKDFVFALGGTYSLADSKMDGPDYKGKLKDHYSIYLEPTYLLNDKTGVFLNLSYNNAKDTAKADSDGITFSKDVSGYGYGVGIKNFIDKNLFVKAQVNYVKYDSENTTSSDDVATTISPKTTTALISVGYKF